FVAVAAVISGATSLTVLAYGLGSILLGALIALLLHRAGHRAFFAARRETAAS
ncbi:MAG: hypothetical protein JOZ89_07770, partial [Gammaproteobacteria bacterium]|nr:hypothetical protein [Gammaproteobacteria bacterium]